MTQHEAIHSLACKTAREFLNCTQELGFDSSDALVAMELTLTIVVLTVSIMAVGEDHKAYMVEVLDKMTENCVANVSEISIIELGHRP
jgi:hypothetical protein